MDPRFVTQKIHAYLDYPVAFALMTLPFLLGLGATNPIAMWLSVATGVAAFVLTLLTDHETGVFRVLPYSFHLAVDGAVAIAFLAAPLLFGFKGLDALYYAGLGATVLVVVGLHRRTPDATTALKRA